MTGTATIKEENSSLVASDTPNSDNYEGDSSVPNGTSATGSAAPNGSDALPSLPPVGTKVTANNTYDFTRSDYDSLKTSLCDDITNIGVVLDNIPAYFLNRLFAYKPKGSSPLPFLKVLASDKKNSALFCEVLKKLDPKILEKEIPQKDLKKLNDPQYQSLYTIVANNLDSKVLRAFITTMPAEYTTQILKAEHEKLKQKIAKKEKPTLWYLIQKHNPAVIYELLLKNPEENSRILKDTYWIYGEKFAGDERLKPFFNVIWLVRVIHEPHIIITEKPDLFFERIDDELHCDLTKIEHHQTWINTLNRAIEAVNKTPYPTSLTKDQLLSLMGFVYLSFAQNDKAHIAKAIETWLRINSPDSIPTNENQAILNKLHELVTAEKTSELVDIELQYKYITHFHHAQIDDEKSLSTEQQETYVRICSKTVGDTKLVDETVYRKKELELKKAILDKYTKSLEKHTEELEAFATELKNTKTIHCLSCLGIFHVKNENHIQVNKYRLLFLNADSTTDKIKHVTKALQDNKIPEDIREKTRGIFRDILYDLEKLNNHNYTHYTSRCDNRRPSCGESDTI